MTLKAKVIVGVIALAVAFAFGRFTTPVKTVIDQKLVETNQELVKKLAEETKRRHTETVVKEVVRPDGTRETESKTTTDTQTDKKVDTEKTSEIDRVATTHKEVIQASSKVTISALYGVRLSGFSSSPPVVYGGSIQRPLLGPVTLGLFGLSDLTFGASLGVAF